MMIKATYQQLVERIARLSGLDVEEIKRRVEAKRSKLSGLISVEGAAQVVAAELGISFEKQKFKVVDLLTGMKKVQVIGKVLETYPIRKYKRARHEGEIGTFLLADDTSSIRTVLWDTNHIDLIKSQRLKKGSVIEIKNADVRGTTMRELHLGSIATINFSDKEIKAVEKTIQVPEQRKISNIQAGEQVSLRATIVQMFQPTVFSACPECGTKASYEGDKAICMKHGTIVPQKRAIMNLVLDDGTENIRAIAFNEIILNLFKMKEEEMDKLQDSNFLLQKKQEFLGEEMLFVGRPRKNVLFNRDEFVINNTIEINPEELIKELS